MLPSTAVKEQKPALGVHRDRRGPLATRASRLNRAVPRSMDRVQFEHILENASRAAIVLIGIFAFAVAMALGKFILAPIALAIVVGLMFGPIADGLERRGVPSSLSAGVVVLLLL